MLTTVDLKKIKEIVRFEIKTELKKYSTKDDLKKYATKDDLNNVAKELKNDIY